MIRSGIITLITDFGWHDGYVGALKGVILSINPNAVIVDITHEIEPQNISQAAYVLSTVYNYYPDGSIHVIIVDPGVGTARKAILVKSSSNFFIAPDNGVLSYVTENDSEFFEINECRFMINPVSSTFHGRDVFAPIAAHLSLGNKPEEFGDSIYSIKMLPSLLPEVKGDLITGKIVHVDNFGNLITNVIRTCINGFHCEIEVAGRVISGLISSYSEGDELLALINSNDKLEIAIKNGSAAEILNVKSGDKVIIRKFR